MAKYIDAEKLVAEIERRKDIYIGHALCLKETNLIDGFDEALNIIESLQQEQHPLPSNLDEAAIQAANQMEIPTEHSQPESLTLVIRHIALKMFKAGAEWMARQMKQEKPEVDLVANLKHHLATTPKEQLEKEWKELEKWNDVGPTVQEFLYGKQPEVDLEKEIDKAMESDLCPEEISGYDFCCIAHHFFELGLNARKIE